MLTITTADTTRRQRGITLVELMVGIAVGLFIVAAASFMLSNQLDDNRRLVLDTQLQQDLRSAADLVSRDLRRAGYWGNAEQGAWLRGVATAANPYTAIDSAASGVVGNRVTYTYSLDSQQTPPQAENDAVDGHDNSGFRLNEGAIELQLGDNNWQKITDPATLTITVFDVTMDQQDIPLEAACPKTLAEGGVCAGGGAVCPPVQQMREFQVRIDGQATNDPAVQRSMRTAVRVRNDVVNGQCPA
jgi:prepilin peptidase dependent protein B